MPCCDNTRAGVWLWFFSAREKRSTLFCCSGQNRSTASLVLSTVSKGTMFPCPQKPAGKISASLWGLQAFCLGEKWKLLLSQSEIREMQDIRRRSNIGNKGLRCRARECIYWKKILKCGTKLVSGLVTEILYDDSDVFFHFLSPCTSVLHMRKHHNHKVNNNDKTQII